MLMLRRIIILGCCLVLVGCAKKTHEPVPVVRTYLPAASSALVFHPPLARAEPAVTLPRESRERAAFWGYEEQTATYHYLRIEDRQDQHGGSSHWDRYQRDSFTVREGVSYR